MRQKIAIITHADDRLQPDDRRGAPRVEVRLKVEFSELDSTRVLQGVVTNLSRSGMRMRATLTKRMVDPDHLRFWIYHGNALIRVMGRVVRRLHSGEIAVEFDDPGTISQFRVDEIVEREAVKNLRFETIVQPVEGPSALGRSAQVKGVLQVARDSNSSFHDSLSALQALKLSLNAKWLARRVATHL
ncbi:MAG: PilZ domain-containing protein [Cyanobacteria bacterium REEB65]|nr:PilZ domain-containing protein [Cyanobacteria bacterium REEB65]